MPGLIPVHNWGLEAVWAAKPSLGERYPHRRFMAAGLPCASQEARPGQEQRIQTGPGEGRGEMSGWGGWLEIPAGRCGFCPSPKPGAHRFVISLCSLDSQLLPEAQVVPQPRDLPPHGAGEVPPLSFPFFLSLSLLQTTGTRSFEPFTPHHCCAVMWGTSEGHFGSAGSQHQRIPQILTRLQQLPRVSGNNSHG